MNIDYKEMNDEELLATIIMDSKAAGSLYERFESLKDIVMDASEYELSQVYGIGRKRILQLRALKELSKRIYQPEPITRYKVSSPQLVYDLVFADIAYQETKCFGTILVDNKLQLIKKEIVSIGTIGTALLDSRLVYTKAVRKSASRIFVFTNGSSGLCNPEKIDYDMCKKMVSAGSLLGIPLTDYIIISPGNFFSFSENQLL